MYEPNSTASTEDRVHPYSSLTNADRDSTISEPDVPDWWKQALQRIVTLLDLPENWDSYGAKPINRQAAYNAIQILQQIAPSGMQIGRASCRERV